MDHMNQLVKVDPKGRVAIGAVAWGMVLVAASLAVASAMHLSGQVRGRAEPPFDADHAGVAEAIIGAVLVIAVIVMLRSPARARAAGLVGTGFATVGFLWGLSITAR